MTKKLETDTKNSGNNQQMNCSKEDGRNNNADIMDDNQYLKKFISDQMFALREVLEASQQNNLESIQKKLAEGFESIFGEEVEELVKNLAGWELISRALNEEDVCSANDLEKEDTFWNVVYIDSLDDVKPVDQNEYKQRFFGSLCMAMAKLASVGLL